MHGLVAGQAALEFCLIEAIEEMVDEDISLLFLIMCDVVAHYWST